MICLRPSATRVSRWQAEPGIGMGAMAVVMAGEWVQYLARLRRDLDQAVGSRAKPARLTSLLDFRR